MSRYSSFKKYRASLNRFSVNELQKQRARLERFIELLNAEIEKRNHDREKRQRQS